MIEIKQLMHGFNCWCIKITPPPPSQDLLLYIATHSDLHCPGGVVSKDLLFCEGDFEGTKLLAATSWPVLLTLLLAALLQVGYHDDGGRSLLPHQPPEVNKHVLFRA